MRNKKFDPNGFLRTLRRLSISFHQEALLHPYPRVRSASAEIYPAMDMIYNSMKHDVGKMTKNEALNFIAKVSIQEGHSSDAIPLARTIITRADYDQWEKFIPLEACKEVLTVSPEGDMNSVLRRYLEVLQDQYEIETVVPSSLEEIAYTEIASKSRTS